MKREGRRHSRHAPGTCAGAGLGLGRYPPARLLRGRPAEPLNGVDEEACSAARPEASAPGAARSRASSTRTGRSSPRPGGRPRGHQPWAGVRPSLRAHRSSQGTPLRGGADTRRLHSALGYLSPKEFERRAAAARCPMGTEGHREQTNLEPLQSGRPAVHNHPRGGPPTPVSERDLIPSAIVHPSAGDDSPQPAIEPG